MTLLLGVAHAESEQLIIPPLHCPIPPLVSNHVEEVDERTIEWACAHGLVSDDREKHKLREGKFGWFGARVHPHDSFDELSLVTDWLTWLFYHDDIWCDDVATKRRGDLRRFIAAHQRFIDILNGMTVRTERYGPLESSLADIQRRLLERTSIDGSQLFIRSVKDYFEGNLWEVSNHTQGIIPDMTTYLKMRPFAGGVNTCLEIGCIVTQIRLTPDVREHLYVRQLTLLANNCATWINDLFSLSKEIREGNMSNLVVTVRNERQSSLQAAINTVAEMCNAEIRAFGTLLSRFSDTPSLRFHRGTHLQRYIALLERWIRGNLDWSIETKRYSGYVIQPSASPNGSSAISYDNDKGA